MRFRGADGQMDHHEEMRLRTPDGSVGLLLAIVENVLVGALVV